MVDNKNMATEILDIIKSKSLKIRYAKSIRSLFILFCLTTHINLSIIIKLYHFSFDYGCFQLGLDFNYRLKNIDHKGINIILKLLFFEIEIECSDNRHIEDYKNNKEQNYERISRKFYL